MTKREAKELSLEVWRYIAEHGLSCKDELPYELGFKIDRLKNRCPLCDVFFDENACDDACPLYREQQLECNEDDSIYYRWYSSDTPERRTKYAGEIVRTIEAWKIEEDV